MSITNFNLKIKDRDLTIFAPENDQTWYGNLVGIQSGDFPFEKIRGEGDILDIGSNIGLVSIVCAVLYPDKNVYAYDACDWAAECLSKTIERNGIKNLFVFNKAVTTSEKYWIEFSHEDKGPSYFIESKLTTEADHPSSGIKVPSIHIKDVLGKRDKISFLKMDIEGGEFEIFDYLFEKEPDFKNKIGLAHIEVHDINEKSKDLVEKLWETFPESSEYISSHKHKYNKL